MSHIVEREHGYIQQHNSGEATAFIRAYRNYFDENGVLQANVQEFVSTGSQFEAPSHKLNVQIPRISNQPMQVMARRAAVGYLLRPLGANRQALFAETNLIRYADVWPDVDIEISLGPRGVKVDYVVTGPSAPASIDLSLTPLGPSNMSQQPDGTILLEGSDGRGDFLFPLPVGQDGREGSFQLNGSTLTVIFPDLSGVSYPYRVDPYSVLIGRGSELSSIYDGYAQRTSANSVWSDLRDGNGTSVNTGATTFNVGWTTGTTTDRYNNIYRGIVNFPTTTGNHIPAGAQIVGATVTLAKSTLSETYSTDPGYNVIIVHGGENTFSPAAATYQDVGAAGTPNGGGAFAKWSGNKTMESGWSNNTDNVFTLNSTALAALPNRSAGQTEWNLGVVVEETECDGGTPPWESSVSYTLNIHSNDSATASYRPLLTLNYELQPTTTYYIF
jgi:hypothetical protein